MVKVGYSTACPKPKQKANTMSTKPAPTPISNGYTVLGRTVNLLSTDEAGNYFVAYTGTVAEEAQTWVALEEHYKHHPSLAHQLVRFPLSRYAIEVISHNDDHLRLNTLPFTNVPVPNGIRKKRSPKTKAHMHPLNSKYSIESELAGWVNPDEPIISKSWLEEWVNK
jgi:hypothetical protein